MNDMINKDNNSHISRRIDDLGRIVIPKTIREQVGFEIDDRLYVIVVDGGILLKKVNYEVDI